MKVAVYTIALNEEQFVRRWFESSKEADYHFILDTGSTDLTRRIALELGIHVEVVSIKPWRFDMARNTSLFMLPEYIDYCIALDMDEVLVPGWRQELEKAFEAGWTRPRYQYTWSWKEDGTPGLQYGGDKIHARHGYRWKHPVHEVVGTYGEAAETQGWVGLNIEHHPDHSKSRGQYFPMLKMAVDEDPYDDRNAFYYARELYFNRMYDEASAEFKRHLTLPKATWRAERAASYRYLAKCEPQEAEKWLKMAVSEDPVRREAKVELSEWYRKESRWQESYDLAKKALDITEKPLDYLCEDFAWYEMPYDLLALSAYYLGKYDEALVNGRHALSLQPDNERLKENMKFYLAATNSSS
jgi:tetratricopeptide (TPR) repeat protein